MREHNTILQVLKLRPFLFLWLAEIFSQIAMNMINFVLIIVAFKLTNSNTAVSGIVLSFTIPAIFLGVFAGVLVDRTSKKKVLFVTNIIRALFLLLLFFTHQILFFVYLLSFLISVATQFFIPAETPMIPVLVRRDLLLSANALFGMGIYGSALLAYALTGPSLLLFGEKYIFVFLSILFITASFFVSLIQYKKDTEKLHTKVSFVGEFKNAFSFFRKVKKIYSPLFLLVLSQLIILILAVIGPGYAQNILKIQVERFPIYFVAPAALGMVVGALILVRFFKNYSKENTATVGVFLSSFSIGLLPFVSGLINIVVVAFLLGFANALVFVPSNTLLQEETEEGERGKVYGLLNTLSGIALLLPVVLVGGLVDLFGVSYVILGIAIVIGIIAIKRII